jgi:hypothetical protein
LSGGIAVNQYCVIARFDKETDKIFGRLKAGLKKVCSFDGTEGWPPHITLGAYENLDKAVLDMWTKGYADYHSPFKVRFSSLGVFPEKKKNQGYDAIYAVPGFGRELTDFYYGFHEKYDEYCGDVGRSYSMVHGQPAIHASLVFCKSAEFEPVFKNLCKAFAPFVATVTALEIYALPVRLLEHFDLRAQPNP